MNIQLFVTTLKSKSLPKFHKDFVRLTNHQYYIINKMIQIYIYIYLEKPTLAQDDLPTYNLIITKDKLKLS